MSHEELFEWIKINQSDNKLTQEQVDIANKFLNLIKADTVYELLAKVTRWDNEVESPVNTNLPYNLTVSNLQKVYPSVNVKAIPFILEHAPTYGITTKKQMCAFLATCIIESNGFNAKRESFAYSPNRLLEVFPRFRIPNLSFAKNLVSQGQSAIANHLYNGRMGNRAGSNDGWDYRGNSWIQLTGRDNHYEMQKISGIPVGDNPKLLEDLESACIVTMAWWKHNGCNELAEGINLYSDGYSLNTLNSKGVETKNFRMNTGAVNVRKRVNGGLNGFTEFCQVLEKCFKYL